MRGKGWGARAAALAAALAAMLAVSEVRAQENADGQKSGAVQPGQDARPGPQETTTGDDAARQAYALHAQGTFTDQGTLAFTSPYRGPNSLDPGARSRETVDATLYGGLRAWPGAEIWIAPEIDQGFGLNDTLGVAGFPSGEAYKVGQKDPYIRLTRLFLRQTIDLGGESASVDPDQMVLGGRHTANRLVFTAGKFSVGDVFDTNQYAHDPRGDFLNWTLIDTGTFDYAADAWGYTYGMAGEWYQGANVLRLGLFDMSKDPNGERPDDTFTEFQIIAEAERDYSLFGEAGKLRVTGFDSRARMGDFADALRLAAETGETPNVLLVRRYHGHAGIGFNLEQSLTGDLGMFMRGGLNDGHQQAYEFTDVDKTFALGFSLAGKRWGRPDDVVGLAGVANDISRDFKAYLAAGGLGILVGDGRLPHPGAEQILETYYDWAPTKPVHVTLDYQFVQNPAYNSDRGPVSILAVRLHGAL